MRWFFKTEAEDLNKSKYDVTEPPCSSISVGFFYYLVLGMYVEMMGIKIQIMAFEFSS